MANVKDKSTLSQLSIAGVHNNHFRTSSTACLAKKIKEGNSDKFRALLSEFEEQGDVPHDSSILSPAAYLADLLRMVDGKSKHTWHKDHTLKARRPDIWKISLDAEHTTTQERYLLLANRAMGHRLGKGREGDDKRRHELHKVSRKPNGGFRYAEFKARTALSYAGHDLPEVMTTLGQNEEAKLARMSMTSNESYSLGQAVSYRNAWKEAGLLQAVYNCRLDSPTAPGVNAQDNFKGLVRRMGIAPELLAEATGDKVFHTEFSYMITFEVMQHLDAKLRDRFAGTHYWLGEVDGAPMLMFQDHEQEGDTTPRPIETKPIGTDYDIVEIYFSYLVELKRITTIAEKTGWPIKDFIYLIKAYGWSILGRISFSSYYYILEFADMRAFQLDHDLSLEEVSAIFIEPLHLAPDYPYEESTWFERTFPGKHWGDEQFNLPLFHGHFPSWFVKAHALDSETLTTILQMPDRLRIKAMPVDKQAAEFDRMWTQSIIDAKTLFAPYRYKALSKAFDISVPEILMLQFHIGLPFSTPVEVKALIEALEMVAASGLSVTEVLSLTNVATTVIYPASELTPIAKLVAAQLPYPIEPEGTTNDSPFWNDQIDAVKHIMCEHYKISFDLLGKILHASMAYDDQRVFFINLLTGHYEFLSDTDPVRPDEGAIAFGNFLTAMAFVKTFEVDGNTLFRLWNERFFGLGKEKIHDWRSIETIPIWAKIRAFQKTNAIKITDMIEALETASYDYYEDQTEESKAAREFSPKKAACFALMSEYTGLSTADLLPYWSADEDALPFMPADEKISYAQRIMDLCEMGKLSQATGSTLKELKALANFYTSPLVLGATTPPRDWKELNAITDAIMAGLEVKLAPKTWKTVVEKTEIDIVEAERDALCTTLLLDHYRTPDLCQEEECNWTLPKGKLPIRIEDREGLSDYFLLDIEMGGTAKISPVKLALNSVQQYVQRVISKKESPTIFSVDENQWTWRSHYRLWEANRKVFLFPENFLDPSLRCNKTEIFKELEEALLQANIDEDTVSAALLGYLDKLQDLSELEIISACAARLRQPGALEAEHHIIFLGRAAGPGSQHYLRSCICDRETGAVLRWTPWEVIHLTAHAEAMSITVVNNRVHLFWVEVQEVGQTSVDAGAKREKAFFGSLKFSVKRLGAGWSDPRVVEDLEHFHLGSIAQQSDRSWKVASKSETLKVRYPSDIPQVSFEISGALRDDSNPNSRHPRIVPKIELDEDLCVLTGDGTAALKDIPSASFWAWTPSDVTSWAWAWKTTPDVYARLPEDRTPNVLYREEPVSKYRRLDTISLASRPNEKNVFGVFHDPTANARDDTRYVLRSTDAGKSWFSAMAVLNDPETGEVLPAKDVDPRAVFIPNDAENLGAYLINGAPHTGIFYSDYGSDNWKGVKLPKGMKTFNACAIGNSGKVIVLSGATDSTSANGLLSISTDGGESWTNPKNVSRSGNAATDIVYDPATNSILVKIAGHVHASHDLGKTWAALPATNPSGKHIGPNEGLMLARDGYIYGFNWRICFVSSDGGRTFKKFGKKTPENIVDIFRFGADTFVHCTNSLYQLVAGEWRKLDHDIGSSPIVLARSGLENQLLAGIKGKGLSYTLPKQTVTVFAKPNGNGEFFTSASRLEQYFSTTAPAALGEILTSHGIDSLMSLETQKKLFPAQRNETKYYRDIDFRLSNAFAQYYRELFFHVPYLIADTLNRHKKFKAAKRWYSFIFDPNLIGKTPFHGDETPFWRYRPFRNYKLEDLQDCVDAEFDIYENDPFDAHAIAAIRLGSYERAVVMRYIDNLLDWGDELFARDNWESITEAMLYYSEAFDLLGPDPSKHRSKDKLPASRTVDAFLKDTALVTQADNSFHLEDRKVFPIPVNTHFDKYWTRVNDRLAKIRAGENLKGVHRDLALFQAPIDPRKIMAAMASGMSPSEAVDSLGQVALRQRFTTLLQSARNFTGTVVQFGNSLMSALEKRDADGLEKLRTTQAQNLLNFSTRIKEIAVTNAEMKLEGLKAQAADAKSKWAHYEKLHSDGLIGPEKDGLRLKNDMLGLQSSTAAIRLGSAPGYLTPTIFGMADGGSNIGRSIEVAASALDSTATALSTSSSMADQRGQNDRRMADWAWQKKQAKAEMDRIAIEIKIAAATVDQATRTLSAHQADMDHHDELANYARDRFTNQQLYAWLAGQMSAVYKQGFNLAQEFAHDAERAHRFERCLSQSTPQIIRQRALVSLNGSLASGQQLQLALGHLEKANRAALSAEIEVEKTLSLKTIGDVERFDGICDFWSNDPDDPGDLRSVVCETGVLEFTITQAFLENDQLGAGYRRIKSIGVTLPAIVGPYQNVNGVLSQIWYKSPDNSKVERTGANSERIAISKGVKDFGTTLTPTSSDHYLPFEFTGAESHWRLELPKEANKDILDSLSDVIIHLNYIMS